MREIVFLKQQRKKWDLFEELMENPEEANPDELADLFIEVTDDLSYARTFYPHSASRNYLNRLASKVHLTIYANKKEKWSRLWEFWTKELPLEVYDSFRELKLSAIFIGIFVFIGVLSAGQDENFVRMVLGDYYVNMTIENIREGDPMAVYKDSAEWSMFSMIAFNNIRVCLLSFALGILFSLGTVYILFVNGIMLGAFHYLLHKYGELETMFYTVYIHGTIEISMIVISGAAGLAMGNSLLFPGTYTRLRSFQRGAKRGLKLVVGVMPFIILAAWLESFVTRHYQESLLANLLVIFISLALVVFYYILYPIHMNNQRRQQQAEPQPAEQ